ncbi:MAG TPA: hypothetical protein VFS91_09195 [Nitrobacter sp.]|nr:hypothetical protein [Nitrobacter sp.]
MGRHGVVLFSGILAGGIAAAAHVAPAEEYRGTFAQRMACTPDVFRLCRSEMPDVGRIVACLRQNQTLLGAPCRAVFESNAEATPGDIAAKASGNAVEPGNRQ